MDGKERIDQSLQELLDRQNSLAMQICEESKNTMIKTNQINHNLRKLQTRGEDNLVQQKEVERITNENYTLLKKLEKFGTFTSIKDFAIDRSKSDGDALGKSKYSGSSKSSLPAANNGYDDNVELPEYMAQSIGKPTDAVAAMKQANIYFQHTLNGLDEMGDELVNTDRQFAKVKEQIEENKADTMRNKDIVTQYQNLYQ
ncbi:hypothetical protein H4219_005325 [Mycoemilia scoparia]|uniref:Uncharacterized protein n=1 Tax=Mycoemilia scoparia TaxID=417184 RepID=A0A9W7ZY20_9FUNG|nr:hypothetical protein H4219_005325 [Mycoemilia scoparia]